MIGCMMNLTVTHPDILNYISILYWFMHFTNEKTCNFGLKYKKIENFNTNYLMNCDGSIKFVCVPCNQTVIFISSHISIPLFNWTNS